MDQLRRTLGWPAIAAYGLGTILGAGIYSVIGAAAAKVGDGMWWAFVASSLVALVTALAYAELATMFPKAGGEFIYMRHALPRQRMVAFSVGSLMAASCAATAATVSIAFAGYLSSIAEVPPAFVAPALLVVLGAVALVGIKESTWMVAVFTCIEASGLVLVIVIGATHPGFGEAFATAPHANILAGAALVFFSFLGFENIVNLAEETRDPERSLPRAILVSLGVATLLYVLVAVASVALLPAEDLGTSRAPLADAIRVRSPSLAGALGGIALFATANTAMASIVSGSRILYSIAREGELPAALARVSSKRRIPWLATIAIVGLSLVLLPLGTVAIVASVSSFTALLAFAAVNCALIVLRVREPATRRPFRVPLSIRGVPVLAVFGALSAVLLVTQLAGDVLLAGGALVVATIAVYAISARVRGRSHVA